MIYAKRISTILLYVLLLTVMNWAYAQEEISKGTIERINWKNPENTNKQSWYDWKKAKKEDFPWPPTYYIDGWIKENRIDGSRAGIYLGFDVTYHPMVHYEISQDIRMGFAEDDAKVEKETAFGFYGYEMSRFVLKSPHGNGLFFSLGEVPTTGVLLYSILEQEKESGLFPIFNVCFFAPTQYFSSIEPEFDEFMKGLQIKSGKIILAKEEKIERENVKVNDESEEEDRLSEKDKEALSHYKHGLGYIYNPGLFSGLETTFNLQSNYTIMAFTGMDLNNYEDGEWSYSIGFGGALLYSFYKVNNILFLKDKQRITVTGGPLLAVEMLKRKDGIRDDITYLGCMIRLSLWISNRMSMHFSTIPVKMSVGVKDNDNNMIDDNYDIGLLLHF